jgi:trk/ktr system potassium uptake protein
VFSLRPILFVVGILLLIVSGLMLLPAAFIAWADTEPGINLRAFLFSSLFALAAGLPSVLLNRRANFQLVPRQMYLLTVMSWLVVNLFCSIPFVISNVHMSMVDAIFETVSGTTTTGSTVMTRLDLVPESILVWRALLQWLGGIGIIVMVVAILSHLRVGGMRLFRSEASDKSEKFTSRSKNVAQQIGALYLSISVLCAIAYWVAGMDVFNAALHAMTTISTGGFSTSDLSMQQFASSAIIWVSCAFMFLSGLPFVLLVQAARGRGGALFHDQQVRGYAAFVLFSVLVIAIWLKVVYEMPVSEALMLGAFNSISIITTTGYTIIDYNLWGGLAVGAFFFLTFTGACAGSTAGGIKIFRFQIAARMLRNQINSMLHPRGEFPNFYNGSPISNEIVTSVIAFSFVFAGTVAVLAMALSLTGLDLTTSLSGAATSVANVGPGLGDIIGPIGNFATLSDGAKGLLTVGMLLGRLEILTVLVILTSGFWRG